MEAATGLKNTSKVLNLNWNGTPFRPLAENVSRFQLYYVPSFVVPVRKPSTNPDSVVPPLTKTGVEAPQDAAKPKYDKELLQDLRRVRIKRFATKLDKRPETPKSRGEITRKQQAEMRNNKKRKLKIEETVCKRKVKRTDEEVVKNKEEIKRPEIKYTYSRKNVIVLTDSRTKENSEKNEKLQSHLKNIIRSNFKTIFKEKKTGPDAALQSRRIFEESVKKEERRIGEECSKILSLITVQGKVVKKENEDRRICEESEDVKVFSSATEEMEVKKESEENEEETEDKRISSVTPQVLEETVRRIENNQKEERRISSVTPKVVTENEKSSTCKPQTEIKNKNIEIRRKPRIADPAFKRRKVTIRVKKGVEIEGLEIKRRPEIKYTYSRKRRKVEDKNEEKNKPNTGLKKNEDQISLKSIIKSKNERKERLNEELTPKEEIFEETEVTKNVDEQFISSLLIPKEEIEEQCDVSEAGITKEENASQGTSRSSEVSSITREETEVVKKENETLPVSQEENFVLEETEVRRIGNENVRASEEENRRKSEEFENISSLATPRFLEEIEVRRIGDGNVRVSEENRRICEESERGNTSVLEERVTRTESEKLSSIVTPKIVAENEKSSKTYKNVEKRRKPRRKITRLNKEVEIEEIWMKRPQIKYTYSAKNRKLREKKTDKNEEKNSTHEPNTGLKKNEDQIYLKSIIKSKFNTLFKDQKARTDDIPQRIEEEKKCEHVRKEEPEREQIVSSLTPKEEMFEETVVTINREECISSFVTPKEIPEKFDILETEITKEENVLKEEIEEKSSFLEEITNGSENLLVPKQEKEEIQCENPTPKEEIEEKFDISEGEIADIVIKEESDSVLIESALPVVVKEEIEEITSEDQLLSNQEEKSPEETQDASSVLVAPNEEIEENLQTNNDSSKNIEEMEEIQIKKKDSLQEINQSEEKSTLVKKLDNTFEEENKQLEENETQTVNPSEETGIKDEDVIGEKNNSNSKNEETEEIHLQDKQMDSVEPVDKENKIVEERRIENETKIGHSNAATENVSEEIEDLIQKKKDILKEKSKNEEESTQEPTKTMKISRKQSEETEELHTEDEQKETGTVLTETVGDGSKLVEETKEMKNASVKNVSEEIERLIQKKKEEGLKKKNKCEEKSRQELVKKGMKIKRRQNEETEELRTKDKQKKVIVLARLIQKKKKAKCKEKSRQELMKKAMKIRRKSEEIHSKEKQKERGIALIEAVDDGIKIDEEIIEIENATVKNVSEAIKNLIQKKKEQRLKEKSKSEEESKSELVQKPVQIGKRRNEETEEIHIEDKQEEREIVLTDAVDGAKIEEIKNAITKNVSEEMEEHLILKNKEKSLKEKNKNEGKSEQELVKKALKIKRRPNEETEEIHIKEKQIKTEIVLTDAVDGAKIEEIKNAITKNVSEEMEEHLILKNKDKSLKEKNKNEENRQELVKKAMKIKRRQNEETEEIHIKEKQIKTEIVLTDAVDGTKIEEIKNVITKNVSEEKEEHLTQKKKEESLKEKNKNEEKRQELVKKAVKIMRRPNEETEEIQKERGTISTAAADKIIKIVKETRKIENHTMKNLSEEKEERLIPKKKEDTLKEKNKNEEKNRQQLVKKAMKIRTQSEETEEIVTKEKQKERGIVLSEAVDEEVIEKAMKIARRQNEETEEINIKEKQKERGIIWSAAVDKIIKIVKETIEIKNRTMKNLSEEKEEHLIQKKKEESLKEKNKNEEKSRQELVKKSTKIKKRQNEETEEIVTKEKQKERGIVLSEAVGDGTKIEEIKKATMKNVSEEIQDLIQEKKKESLKEENKNEEKSSQKLTKARKQSEETEEIHTKDKQKMNREKEKNTVFVTDTAKKIEEIEDSILKKKNEESLTTNDEKTSNLANILKNDHSYCVEEDNSSDEEVIEEIIIEIESDNEETNAIKEEKGVTKNDSANKTLLTEDLEEIPEIDHEEIVEDEETVDAESEEIVIMITNDDETDPELVVRTDEEKYECDKCGYKTEVETNLAKHVISRHTNPDNTNWVSCPHCPFRVKTKENLIRHVKNYHIHLYQWYLCEQCEFKCQRKRAFASHMLNKHMREKSKNEVLRHKNKEPSTWYKCGKCPYKTKLRCYVAKHFKYLHPNDPVSHVPVSGMGEYVYMDRMACLEDISTDKGHMLKCRFCDFRTTASIHMMWYHVGRSHNLVTLT